MSSQLDPTIRWVHCDLTNRTSFGESEGQQQSHAGSAGEVDISILSGSTKIRGGRRFPRFGHECKDQQETECSDGSEKQKHDGVAKHVRDIAGNRGAEGSANADSDADQL
jgi:hypothetical protein